MQLNNIKVKLDEKRIYKLISLMKPIVKNVEKPKWWGNNRSEFEIKIAKKYNLHNDIIKNIIFKFVDYLELTFFLMPSFNNVDSFCNSNG